jgi:uncharacterized protein
MTEAQAAGGTDSGPVTVVVTRRVKPAFAADYERALAALQHDSQALPGYLGATTQRPAPGAAAAEYTSVFRFASVKALRDFEASERRRAFIEQVTPWVLAPAAWQALTGLEFWFSPPPGTVVPQPVRWRMALVMIAVVFSLVLSIGSLVGVLLQGWPGWLRLLLTIGIEVVLMTYWLMPRLTRWLAPWIYRHRPPTSPLPSAGDRAEQVH